MDNIFRTIILTILLLLIASCAKDDDRVVIAGKLQKIEGSVQFNDKEEITAFVSKKCTNLSVGSPYDTITIYGALPDSIIRSTGVEGIRDSTGWYSASFSSSLCDSLGLEEADHYWVRVLQYKSNKMWGIRGFASVIFIHNDSVGIVPYRSYLGNVFLIGDEGVHGATNVLHIYEDYTTKTVKNIYYPTKPDDFVWKLKLKHIE